MQFDWRTILGPALTTAVALIAFFVDRHFVTVPNPAPLFVCIVALASSISGIASGLISAVIAVTFSALFFLNHRAAPGYDPVTGLGSPNVAYLTQAILAYQKGQKS